MTRVLSEIPYLGRVAICKSCDQIHLKYGKITLDLTREEFLGLSRMVGEAEKNFLPLPLDESRVRLSVVH